MAHLFVFPLAVLCCLAFLRWECRPMFLRWAYQFLCVLSSTNSAHREQFSCGAHSAADTLHTASCCKLQSHKNLSVTMKTTAPLESTLRNLEIFKSLRKLHWILLLKSIACTLVQTGRFLAATGYVAPSPLEISVLQCCFTLCLVTSF